MNLWSIKGIAFIFISFSVFIYSLSPKSLDLKDDDDIGKERDHASSLPVSVPNEKTDSKSIGFNGKQ